MFSKFHIICGLCARSAALSRQGGSNQVVPERDDDVTSPKAKVGDQVYLLPWNVAPAQLSDASDVSGDELQDASAIHHYLFGGGKVVKIFC